MPFPISMGLARAGEMSKVDPGSAQISKLLASKCENRAFSRVAKTHSFAVTGPR